MTASAPGPPTPSWEAALTYALTGQLKLELAPAERTPGELIPPGRTSAEQAPAEQAPGELTPPEPTPAELAPADRVDQSGLGRWVRDLVAALPGGLEGLREHVGQRRASGQPWPYPVPPALRAGLSAAQLQAATAQLVEILDLGGARSVVRSGSGSTGLPAGDRRLIEDLPPHYRA